MRRQVNSSELNFLKDVLKNIIPDGGYFFKIHNLYVVISMKNSSSPKHGHGLHAPGWRCITRIDATRGGLAADVVSTAPPRALSLSRSPFYPHAERL